jgi:hypothetical protein
MKRSHSWLVLASLALVACSVISYAVHYLIFRDAYHIFFYLLLDVSFLFLNVCVVILFIERLLGQREKKAKFYKLNMVIGAFFSEVGLDLLKVISPRAANFDSLKPQLEFRPNWKSADFRRATAAAGVFPYQINVSPEFLRDLRALLTSRSDFLVMLLENPNLLDHERFTDLLWAVFHLGEELSFRKGDLDSLPPSDLDHLAVDVQRVCSRITVEWMHYAQHLKGSYPFLFSLAARINPLGSHPSPIVGPE